MTVALVRPPSCTAPLGTGTAQPDGRDVELVRPLGPTGNRSASQGGGKAITSERRRGRPARGKESGSSPWSLPRLLYGSSRRRRTPIVIVCSLAAGALLALVL